MSGRCRAIAGTIRSHGSPPSSACSSPIVPHLAARHATRRRCRRNDNGDALLNEWILAWVAHQLPRAPLRLFDANIFYPAKDTLAFSEPLIVPAILGAPVRWLGGSPVLVFNLALLLGFALTGLAGYALVYSLDRRIAAARWLPDRSSHSTRTR